MWGLDYLREMYMPKGWFVAQVITTVDATTFDVYLKNMKSLFMEMAKDSDLIIFNRSTYETPAATYKRNMRAVNPKAQVVFEKEDGSQLEFEEEMPFDINADVIEISDVDYGIWYIDAMDHPEKYDGKTMRFKAMAYTGGRLPKGYFVPGRMAMTCCEADMTFLGFICKAREARNLENRQWVKVRAKIEYEEWQDYGGVGPVLYAESVEPAEPIKDIVQF